MLARCTERSCRTPTGRRARSGHDESMGQAHDKARKPKHHLAKVPKYEEPNELPLPGLVGSSGRGGQSGRFGHGSDHKHLHALGWPGTLLLRMLGLRRKRGEPPSRTGR